MKKIKPTSITLAPVAADVARRAEQSQKKEMLRATGMRQDGAPIDAELRQ